VPAVSGPYTLVGSIATVERISLGGGRWELRWVSAGDSGNGGTRLVPWRGCLSLAVDYAGVRAAQSRWVT
jgi:hypothetical protein